MDERSVGNRAADWVAAFVGSWRFVLGQNFLILVWMAANVAVLVFRFDPYPFILLNLFMSWQAANATPIIMMSQNRQAAKDRADQHEDLVTNIKAELEIVELHAAVSRLHERFDRLEDAWLTRGAAT